MSRLQFYNQDDTIWDQQGGLPINFGVRAYDPSSRESESGNGVHSGLTDATRGDWSWKPERYDERGRYRVQVIGEPCTCTLHQPVGTDCARHA